MAAFAEQLIERTEPWSNADLEIFNKALAAMFEPLLDLAEETGSDGEPGYIPAWGKLFEVKTASLNELRYLANYVGVTIPEGATEAEARALVEAESGLARGTLASVEGAIKRIIGTAPFTIQERTAANGTAAAYHFNVIVGAGKSSAALKEAIEEVKPGGVLFTIFEVSGAWINVAAGKKWSEATALEQWKEAKEGAP